MYVVKVVVDPQEDFAGVNGSLTTVEGQAAMKIVADEIAKGDFDELVATKDTHDSDYLDTEEGAFLPIIHTQKGTKGHDFVQIVQDAYDNCDKPKMIIEKVSFGSADFANYLVELGKKHTKIKLIFVGVCTDKCVISNVVLAKTFLPNAEVYVVEKACAGVSLEAHDIAIKAMENLFVHVI